MLIAVTAVNAACSGGGDSNQSTEGTSGVPIAPTPAPPPASSPAPPTYSATVTWTPPSLSTDGSALTDAASYRVDYGTSATNLSLSLEVLGGTSTSAIINGLSAGTYYFAVTAVNSAGVASIRSNAASRTLP